MNVPQGTKNHSPMILQVTGDPGLTNKDPQHKCILGPCTLNKPWYPYPRPSWLRQSGLIKARKVTELSYKLLLITIMARASKGTLFVSSWTV